VELPWKCSSEPSAELVERLTSALGIQPILARLLCQRGITSAEEGRSFLEPDIDQLHSPFELYDMDRAVDRIILAIKQKEEIGIFGDFDVDGITSASLLYRFFQKLGIEAHCRLPNRLSDGYGLSNEVIDAFHDQNVTLLVTVDCGITAVDEVNYANGIGIDCIITDHHQPKDILPDGCAVINPRRPECSYPFRDLTGVGLAWKLADAVGERIGEDRRLLMEDLDLVAVGSIADVAPLCGENRILVHHGIDQLARTSKIGFRCLLDVAGLSGRPLGYGAIAFSIAPRINAAGRLGDAWPAFELLTTYSDDLARERARHLDEVNKQRQAIDVRIFQEAMALLDPNSDPGGIVLASETWHPGVIGIVASRLKEHFGRPAVLIALRDGLGRGSARSVPGFSLHKALEKCSDILERAGGHALAAGLMVKEANIEAFRERFQELFLEEADKVASPDTVTYDVEIPLKNCDRSLFEEMEKLEPFGPANQKPLLLARDVSAPTGFRRVGKNHVKFLASRDGTALDAIAFQVGHDMATLWNRFDRLDLIFSLEENRWGGQTTLQLNVKNVRESEGEW